MPVARRITELATRAAGSDLVDRLFAPHGVDAYLGAVIPGAPAMRTQPPESPESGSRDAGASLRSRVPTSAVAVASRPAADPSGLIAGDGGSVHFSRSAVSSDVSTDGSTILTLAEQNGLEPRNRCRRGICGTCTATKTAGVVRDVRTGELSGADEAPIRICVSVPCGDVSVAL